MPSRDTPKRLSVSTASLNAACLRARFFAGERYSIADNATFTWLASWERKCIVLSGSPNLV